MTSKVAHLDLTGTPSRMPSGKRTLQGQHAVQGQRPCMQLRGFAYVLLLVSVAVLAVSATATLRLGAQMGRRDAEQALLFVGSEFERALRSYAGLPVTAVVNANQANTNQSIALQASVSQVPPFATGPRTLEELLQDPRTPGVRRHLRKIYADPLTGLPNWGLVKDPAGYIIGVYSLADGQPIQQTGFGPQRPGFESAPSYSAWVFGLPAAQTKR